MASFSFSAVLLTLAIVLLLAHPAHAFGAGNIASVAKIEGLNWRHGDIEDTLLTLVMSRAAGGKKFDKMNVARVYFGNWLRDYSQAIDVGTVKYVSAEAIRILLWVLGFMTFGYGTKEFEVTAERLGCYRPEDHIDNPKDYADNMDATQYDRRLRGPVNERVELAIDPKTGLKNYIANEHVGIMTSALHIRKLFGRSIQLGRSYARSKNDAELHEALRLLGTGLHCLEDFSAHSNYTELALIEMGEREVFPHVGRQTQLRLQGAQHPVYPVITGTFGGVDFLHSVMGEFSDKATQSEIQDLEGTMEAGGRSDNSLLKDLLNKIPSGLFGGKNEASKADELQANATAAQMTHMRVSPRQPEAFTKQMLEVSKQIFPIIEWHDELMKSITEAIEKIPILPALIDQLEDQVNIFVFSLLAPFVLPIISQIKNELNTGSSEIIQSSQDKQLIVFHDDHSTDPTHSMLSKDHFSNILNEPAGKIASQVLKWVVPQLIACWDDERIDPERTISRIINGVFHHPALRNQGEDGAADGRRLMFGVVEGWWRSKDQQEQQDLRRQLSRDGVMNGENHKEGVEDSGHGCGKPLGMAKSGSGGSGIAGGLAGGLAGGALMEGLSALGGEMSSGYGSQSGRNDFGRFAEEAAGGGELSGLVGALAAGIGGSAFSGGSQNQDQRYEQQGYQSSGYEQRQESSYGGVYERGTETQSWGQAKVDEGRQYSGYGERERYEESQRQQEYGGYGREEPQRQQEYGGYGREEPQRQQEYGSYGGREEPQRERSSGGGFGGLIGGGLIGGLVGGFAGNEGGWGGDEEQERPERKEEYREESYGERQEENYEDQQEESYEEQQEEREDGGGGWGF